MARFFWSPQLISGVVRRLGSEPSVDASSQDLHSASSQHQAECQSRRMHTQQAASTATAPLAPSTACAMLVVIRASCLAVTRRSSHLAATASAHAHTHARTHTHTHAHAYAHAHAHAHAHAYKRALARTHECPHSHTCTHVTRGLRSPPQSRALLPGSIEA
jgi:hypothetical protein